MEINLEIDLKVKLEEGDGDGDWNESRDRSRKRSKSGREINIKVNGRRSKRLDMVDNIIGIHVEGKLVRSVGRDVLMMSQCFAWHFSGGRGVLCIEHGMENQIDTRRREKNE